MLKLWQACSTTRRVNTPAVHFTSTEQHCFPIFRRSWSLKVSLGKQKGKNKLILRMFHGWLSSVLGALRSESMCWLWLPMNTLLKTHSYEDGSFLKFTFKPENAAYW